MCVCTRACDGIGNRVACLCVCTRVCMGASMGLCMQAATHSYQVNLNCSPRYRESYRYISVVLLCIGCVISQPALAGVISFVSSLSHRHTYTEHENALFGVFCMCIFQTQPYRGPSPLPTSSRKNLVSTGQKLSNQKLPLN